MNKGTLNKNRFLIKKTKVDLIFPKHDSNCNSYGTTPRVHCDSEDDFAILHIFDGIKPSFFNFRSKTLEQPIIEITLNLKSWLLIYLHKLSKNEINLIRKLY